jgi:hypothetical protein
MLVQLFTKSSSIVPFRSVELFGPGIKVEFACGDSAICFITQQLTIRQFNRINVLHDKTTAYS